MAGIGKGSFDRQEEFVLHEVAYSGGEADGNSAGGGVVVGEDQPARSGISMRDLRTRLISRSRLYRKEDLAILVGRWVSPGFDALFLASVGECAFGHDMFKDGVGAIAAIHVLFQVGCVDVERAARPQEAAWLIVSNFECCGAGEKAGSSVGFGGIGVEGRG